MINNNPINIFRLILLIEGVASIGIQFLVMRLTTPFVGSSVVPTSIIITTILLFLALGYRSGGRFNGDAKERIATNLLIAAGCVAVGLSEILVSVVLGGTQSTNSGLSTFVLLPMYLLFFIAPAIYLLAQVIPLVIALDKTEQGADTKAGDSYFYSTIGNVVGGLFLTLVVLYFFGPAVATIGISVSLLALSLMIKPKQPNLATAVFIAVVAILINHLGMYPKLMDSSQYADRMVVDNGDLKELLINNSHSSGVRRDGRAYPYAEFIRKHHLKPGMEVVILGAGGFVLGDTSPETRFTYVDIDSKLKEFAEEHFLGKPIHGNFVVQDARVFVNTTKSKFDLLVIDTFGSTISIPEHLKTIEFYKESARVLKPGGRIVINVIHNNTPKTFDHAIARSIHGALGFCSVTNIQGTTVARSNYIYDCQPTEDARHFTDKRVSLFNSPKGF